MGICGSLMDIFDYPQARSANKTMFICCWIFKDRAYLLKVISNEKQISPLATS